MIAPVQANNEMHTVHLKKYNLFAKYNLNVNF